MLFEEYDVFPITATADGPYGAAWSAFGRAMEHAGAAPSWVRTLPARCVELGFVDVATDVDVPLFTAGSPEAEFWRLTWLQTADRMVAAGTPREADRCRDCRPVTARRVALRPSYGSRVGTPHVLRPVMGTGDLQRGAEGARRRKGQSAFQFEMRSYPYLGTSTVTLLDKMFSNRASTRIRDISSRNVAICGILLWMS